MAVDTAGIPRRGAFTEVDLGDGIKASPVGGRGNLITYKLSNGETFVASNASSAEGLRFSAEAQGALPPMPLLRKAPR
jgi:hypothetical protein